MLSGLVSFVVFMSPLAQMSISTCGLFIKPLKSDVQLLISLQSVSKKASGNQQHCLFYSCSALPKYSHLLNFSQCHVTTINVNVLLGLFCCGPAQSHRSLRGRPNMIYAVQMFRQTENFLIVPALVFYFHAILNVFNIKWSSSN